MGTSIAEGKEKSTKHYRSKVRRSLSRKRISQSCNACISLLEQKSKSKASHERHCGFIGAFDNIQWGFYWENIDHNWWGFRSWIEKERWKMTQRRCFHSHHVHRERFCLNFLCLLTWHNRQFLSILAIPFFAFFNMDCCMN